MCNSVGNCHRHASKVCSVTPIKKKTFIWEGKTESDIWENVPYVNAQWMFYIIRGMILHSATDVVNQSAKC